MQLFFFHLQNVWQVSQTGDVIRTTSLTSLWPRLPPKIDAVDAIYQRIQDGIVVVFRGLFANIKIFISPTQLLLQLNQKFVFNY